MRTGTSPQPPPTERNLDHHPETDLLALAEQAARMIAVAHALVRSHRQVDLDGLQDNVGLLCAKALDLPSSKTGFVKLELQRLASAVDALTDSMRGNAA